MSSATQMFEQQFTQLPLDVLRESKTNPRRKFDDQGLKELASSICEKGVLVPLLVRRVEKAGRVPYGRFEIVAGARRFRAAQAAKLEQVPVRIVELSDHEALEVQVIENLQREDVHPLDEALGFRRLLEFEKGKYDVKGLAAKVGKSESYVYQRLKLAELTPAAQKAFLEEKIMAGHAVQIARLQVKDQTLALDHCLKGNASVRELAEFIEEEIHLVLKKAPWDLSDDKLVPRAGACTECPKRTGANPMLFGDVKAKDVCTDPACFHEKQEAHLVQVEATLKKGGREVVRISDSYDRQRRPGVLERGDWQRTHGRECPHVKLGLVVAAEDYSDYKRGMQVEVCTNPKCKIHSGYSSSSYSSSRSPAEREKERKRRMELKRRDRIFLALSQADIKKLAAADLRAILNYSSDRLWFDATKRFVDAMGWPVKVETNYGRKNKDYRGTLEREFKKAREADVPRWLLLFTAAPSLLVNDYRMGDDEDSRLFTLAKAHGVNVGKITREVKAEFDAKKRKGKKAKGAKAKTSQTKKLAAAAD